MSTKHSQVHMDQIAAMRIQAANGQIGYWQIYQTLAILLQTDYCLVPPLAKYTSQVERQTGLY